MTQGQQLIGLVIFVWLVCGVYAATWSYDEDAPGPIVVWVGVLVALAVLSGI